MLCPTRFVVDSMESSNKGGRVAEMCSSQSDWFMIRHSSSRHVCTYTYVRSTSYYVRPNLFGENKKHPPEVRSRDGHTCRTCVAGRATLKSRRPPSLASVQISLLSVCCKPWTQIQYLLMVIFDPTTFG